MATLHNFVETPSLLSEGIQDRKRERQRERERGEREREKTTTKTDTSIDYCPLYLVY